MLVAMIAIVVMTMAIVMAVAVIVIVRSVSAARVPMGMRGDTVLMFMSMFTRVMVGCARVN